MKLRQRDLFTRLLRARPLLLAALLYLAGCLLGHALMPGLPLCAVLIALLSGAALLLRKNPKRICAALLALCFLPLGALLFQVQWRATEPCAEQTDALLLGRICENPDWKEETERTICVLEDVSIDGVPLSGRLRLYLRGDVNLLQAVQLGQRISCTAHIWQAEEASNPGQFDFARYLRLNGLKGYATAKIEEAVFSAPVYRFSDWRERSRSALSRRIERLFPENTGLALALLLGDRGSLSPEEKQSYNDSGAGHLLAISGMHVSVLAAFISLLLGRLLGKRWSYALTLLLLLVYGALIGFSPSLLRAILLFAVYNLAPLLGRHSDAPTRVAAAMLAYLLFRPIDVLDAGFVLSYGSCAGIIFLYAPLSRLLHLDGLLASRPRSGVKYLFTHTIPRNVAQSVLISLSAQLAVVPAVVHYFGAQPLWSLAVNLVAIPLAMLAYILAIIAAVTGVAPLAALPDGLFSLLTRCVTFFGDLPLASLRIARFPLWLSLACAAICFLASDLSVIRERVRRFMPMAVILAALLSNAIAMLGTLGCNIVFLDAGEADCAVVRTQGHVYMIDAGDDYSPAADYLSAMNYHLDGLFISHGHTDHAGGLTDILQVCVPERIYLSANWHSTEIDEAVQLAVDEAVSLGSELVYLSAGDAVALSDKTLLEVLSPGAGISAASANDDSLVLRLSHGESSALFAGDAGAEILAACAVDSDVLKIAHHGARDGTSAAVLDRVSPSAAVIPVGYNTFGHPTQRVLKLLNAAQTRIFRTDLHGAITCRLLEDGNIRINTYKASEEVNGLE